MQVQALRAVAYPWDVLRKTGEQFEMDDLHVFPFEVMGHVKRVVAEDAAEEAEPVKGRKRSRE